MKIFSTKIFCTKKKANYGKQLNLGQFLTSYQSDVATNFPESKENRIQKVIVVVTLNRREMPACVFWMKQKAKGG